MKRSLMSTIILPVERKPELPTVRYQPRSESLIPLRDAHVSSPVLGILDLQLNLCFWDRTLCQYALHVNVEKWKNKIQK